MRVEVDKIRPAYKRAKKEFARTWRGADITTFWKDFGDAHHMKVIIDRYVYTFPCISCLEFADEKYYAWFLLRWS